MATPFIALVSAAATFDPSAHARRDLNPIRLSIKQKEGELAYLQLDILQPAGPLENRRILVSDRGRLLFDGIIQPSPRGILANTITVEAIATGPELEAQIYALTESLKSDKYDALLVPEGSEDDIAEVLSTRAQVVGHSRVQGRPTACNALGGSKSINVRPLNGSLEFSQEANIATTFSLTLTAKWKQIGRDLFPINGINGLETLTADAFLENWPQVGAQIGDGFKVSYSVGEKRRDPQGLTYYPRIEEKPSSLDPAWAAATKLRVRSPDKHTLNLSLSLEYAYEVSRVETATISISTTLQPAAGGGEPETEELTLRELTKSSGARAWQSLHDYAEGDLIVDGGSTYSCRTAHRSKMRRESIYWSMHGETSYLSSRRMSSFFSSDRGRRVLDAALGRINARACIASRCITAKFTSAMPNPWAVDHDTQATIVTDRIPGGSITGRLVEYELLWDRGRRTLSGTIAAVPGSAASGETSQPVITSVDVNAPGAFGRVEHSISNALGDQLAAFNSGGNIPVTTMTIQTTPVANDEYEQEAAVVVSGPLVLPQQVRLT